MPAGSGRKETAPQAGGPFSATFFSAYMPVVGETKAVAAIIAAAKAKRKRIIYPTLAEVFTGGFSGCCGV
jgi:hypothetical protein